MPESKDINTAGEQLPCPVTFALEVFGDRWTLLVLREVMLEGRHRYRDLLSANEGIATNVLADRLKRLEQRGLISRERDPEDARQYIYKPTRYAVSVIPMLVEMMVWGSKHGNGEVPQTFLNQFTNNRKKLIKDLQDAAMSRT